MYIPCIPYIHDMYVCVCSKCMYTYARFPKPWATDWYLLGTGPRPGGERQESE